MRRKHKARLGVLLVLPGRGASYAASMIDHISSYATDYEASKKFYEAVLPTLGYELNVEMVMAGRVRYAGDEVRVSAELINGATNTPIWTEAYDGDLSDIFGIQADIAMNVANALQAEFSITEQESIETPPTDSPEAYELYLKAKAIIRAGLGGGFLEL